MKKLFFYGMNLILAITVSCSQPQKRKKIRHYDQKTNQDFESIEKTTSHAIERYRRMRQNNWSSYTRKRPKKPTKRKRAYRRKTTTTYTRRRTARPRSPTPPLSPAQQREIKIQTEQYSTFFCLKRRKSRKFSNQANCNSYTQNIIHNCKNKSGNQYTKATSRCVKRALRVK